MNHKKLWTRFPNTSTFTLQITQASPCYCIPNHSC